VKSPLSTIGRGARTLLVLALLAAGGCRGGDMTGAETDAWKRHLPVPFRVIAHRGASAYAPENTLPAFERALEVGASEVELDVQLSRDGALVLFHDRTLDGKTNLTGAVRNHTADALRSADIGSWFDAQHPGIEERFAGTGLATLDELFERFGAQLHYHVEIKTSEEAVPALLLARVAAFGLADRVIVSSFRDDQLRRVRALDQRIPICRLIEKRSGRPEAYLLSRGDIDDAVRERFDRVGVHSGDLDRELVRYAHERGLEIRAWGIGGPEDIEGIVTTGANGLTVDWPDVVFGMLAAP
jgi:glycerophosphoryl diester phosphodiesterase